MGDWNKIKTTKDLSTRMFNENIKDRQNEAKEAKSAKLSDALKTSVKDAKNADAAVKSDVKPGQLAEPGKKAPQVETKDASSINKEAANSQAEKFNDAKKMANDLNSVLNSTHSKATSGKGDAAKDATKTNQMNGAEAAGRSATNVRAEPDAAPVKNQAALEKGASMFVKDSGGKVKGDTSNARKTPEAGGQQVKAEAGNQGKEVAQKADPKNAAQVSQLGQAGLATVKPEGRTEKSSSDTGGEKKSGESKKKGDSSSVAGRAYTDGGSKSDELNALMSGFGGSSDDEAEGKSADVEPAARAVAELPEEAKGLKVYCEADSEEMKFLSDARIYFDCVEKKQSDRSEKLKQISEFNAKLDMGMIAVSERVVADGDMELANLLVAGLQSRKNSYGGICG